MFELRDHSVLPMQRSKYNAAVTAKLFPRPLRFRLELEHTKGEKALYVWSAVSPSPRFVALGMVATCTPEPPGLDYMQVGGGAGGGPVLSTCRFFPDFKVTKRPASGIDLLRSVLSYQVSSYRQDPSIHHEQQETMHM